MQVSPQARRRLWPLLAAAAALIAALVLTAPFRNSTPVPKRPAVHLQWLFEAADRGTIAATPCIAGDRIFVGAAHAAGLQAFGRFYCLDRATGKFLWSFDDALAMKQVLSTAVVADGRVYVGEGFHQDAACKLYCLDAATGRKHWSFSTASHVESRPCFAGGKVYFGAGDDGLYCLDAATGREVWHFRGLHVDADPAVQDGRVYCGSGYGGAEMFCLDAGTGKPVWRTPTPGSVFGSPRLLESTVLFGTGNGTLDRSGEPPLGALVCVDAQTGTVRWTFAAGDAVVAAPCVRDGRACFSSRDRHCYCVDGRTGRLGWKRDLGGASVTTPAVSAAACYAVSAAGRLHCLDLITGAARWEFDLATATQTQPVVYSSPVLDPANPRRIYAGAGLNHAAGSAAALLCLEER